MTKLDVPDIHTESLQSELSFETPTELQLRLVGTAETESMEALSALLKRLHREALGHGVREVAVDLRSLEFMNSSCFKAFVSWVGELEEVDIERQYRIRFLSDESRHWQARSLGALTCFATHLIRVEA
jgi:anti-anti-sigma regulatory factor